ncbi:hypothetical protein EPN96_00530 [bacterium]|nr:MAG: hypothetical protein EPN96_00530 [bacterium]
MTDGVFAYERSDLTGMGTAQPIAVVAVGEKGELGNYLMCAILERVPHLCSSIIFWSVNARSRFLGIEINGGAKKEALMEKLETHVKEARKRNLGAAFYYAEGRDEPRTAESLCAAIAGDFPAATFYFLPEEGPGREERESQKLRQRLDARGLTTAVLPLTLADFASA